MLGTVTTATLLERNGVFVVNVLYNDCKISC